MHVLRRAAVAVVATIAAAVLNSFPATVQAPTSITSQAGADARRTNCSGALGAWTGLAHANFGDLTAADGDPAADVVIVGDSITTLAHGELSAWLSARGKTLAGSYWSGRPTTPAVDWALSLSTKPKTLVMASGTNDIFNPGVMAVQVARLKTWAATEPVTRLIWVDVQAARPATALCDQRNSMWVNGQIRSSGVEVCSWSYGFAADPGRIGNYLDPDGIHPNQLGQNYWAAVVGGCIL